MAGLLSGSRAGASHAPKIPLLGDIPIIGPVFFDSTAFLYLTYAMIVAAQFGLFSTRWGLRVRGRRRAPRRCRHRRHQRAGDPVP